MTPPLPGCPGLAWRGSVPSLASVRSAGPLPALVRQVVCTLDVSTEPQVPEASAYREAARALQRPEHSSLEGGDPPG